MIDLALLRVIPAGFFQFFPIILTVDEEDRLVYTEEVSQHLLLCDYAIYRDLRGSRYQREDG